jgi:hypothetical protein
MSKFIHSFFGERRFKTEFKRELRSLITFTLGFTIAFSWRQTIFDLSYSFVQFLTKIQSPNTSIIATSIFTTIVSILLIFLFSHLLKNNPENY